MLHNAYITDLHATLPVVIGKHLPQFNWTLEELWQVHNFYVKYFYRYILVHMLFFCELVSYSSCELWKASKTNNQNSDFS